MIRVHRDLVQYDPKVLILPDVGIARGFSIWFVIVVSSCIGCDSEGSGSDLGHVDVC